MSSSSVAKPEVVHGGCLCEAVRFKVSFPKDHNWEKSCSTCQCSQCRKNSGALVIHLHGIPTTALTLLSQSTLKKYYASLGNARSFCSACGSWLFWQDESSQKIDFAVGTLDQDALRKFGESLAYARRHLWCRDAIKGESDGLQGDKWREDSSGEGADKM